MSAIITAERGVSHHFGFLGACALLFVASVATTVVWCESMAGMGGMEMPNGWTMSMAWMRMPGQTWLDAGASFLWMWAVMMAAMMLPSLTPMLLRYRRSIGALGTPPTLVAWLTLVAGSGYMLVWTLVGALAFPLGAALAALAMQEPTAAAAAPLAVGIVVLIAGGLQFTAWKARQLACCRGRTDCGTLLGGGASWGCGTSLTGSVATVKTGSAWRHGLRLGVRCCYCCAGLTTILLVIGVMDLRTMAVVTAAISAERLAPGGERVTAAVRCAIGAVIMGAGLFLIARELRLA